MALEDYSALIQSGMNLVPDVNKQLEQQAQTTALQAEARNQQAEAQANAQKLNRAQQFQQDIHTFDGSPTSASRLIMKYPEFADHLKQGWDVQDNAKKDADLLTMGEIYSAASGGNWKLAKQLAHTRADAEKAAGYSDPAYDETLRVMDSAADGDPTQQKVVLNMLGTSIAAVTGPEHFATVYGGLTKDKEGYTLPEGGARFNSDNKMVAHSPLIKDESGAIHAWNDGGAAAGGGDPTSGAAGGVSPASASVASALATSGLPAPVVAGFMGNFHAEGGYGGAQGDGGSASGIGQWRGERAANFERIVGKPVTEATPAEQAQFVAWEMQNPEAAGMTVKQRDAILAAKTPAQAAALIDQFYERSSGRDRKVRMSAATAFAGNGSSSDAFPVLIPGKPKDAPSGYRYKGDGSLEAIPGGPADKGNSGTTLTQYGIAPGMTGPDVLQRLPANIASQVKALAEGRLPMPSSFALAKPYWQTMLQLTSQYDPTFDAATAKARQGAITQFTGNGKAAQTVGSINRVANHLDLLWNESKKLAGPDTGFGPLNSVLATAGQSFQPADAKAYDTEVQFVGGELEKIARNSPGTVAGVEKIVSNLGRHNSRETRDAAIKAAVGIISGAVDPLKDQYNSAFSNGSSRPNVPWVSPKAQEIYRRIAGVDTSLTAPGADSNAAPSANTPVHVNSPAEAAKLPSGTLFVTHDGRVMRKR